MRRLAVALALGVALLALPASAGASSFFGLNSWATPSKHELRRMSKGGAGVYRTNVYWQFGLRDWSATDALMLDAAKAHIEVLPVLLSGKPPTAVQEPDFQGWTRALVKRYKPGGTFWRAHRDVKARPIRRYQVWNEPNLAAYWPSEKASEYGAFFVRTAKTIRKAYAHAGVVAAGVPESAFGPSQQTYFKRLYKVKGFKKAVSVIAVHAYAEDYRGVLGAIERTRDVMSSHGDAKKKIWVTETGWATGGEDRPWVTSRKGQAKQLHLTGLALLHRKDSWHLRGMIWFSWRDTGDKQHWGTNTGVFDVDGDPKPSWREFADLAGGSAGSGSL